jgi:hypothetical protein
MCKFISELSNLLRLEAFVDVQTDSKAKGGFGLSA